MNIAIFKTNFLGDNVVFVPVVQALRRQFPSWRLILITSPQTAPLYEADVADADRLLITPSDMQRLWRHPGSLLRWRRLLAARPLDASMISHDQTSMAYVLARLAGGKVRVGGASGHIRLASTLTRRIAWREGWSIAQWNWEIAREFVLALGGGSWPDTPPPPDLSHLTQGVARVKKRVVIHPGSKWEYTRWPLENYVAIAARLGRDCEVLWIDAPETRVPKLPPGVTLAETGDVRTLARLLATAELFVGNNSGPMHVANAVQTPLVVITGPSDFTWDPAWSRASARVLRQANLACQPCDRVHFAPGKCLNQHEPLACLRRWTVDAVERECQRQLAASATMTEARS